MTKKKGKERKREYKEMRSDHDVSQRNAAVGVFVNAAIDVLNDLSACSRQLWSDDVEQVADDDLAVAATVEERAEFFEVLVAQLNAEVGQSTLQRPTRDLPRRTAAAIHLSQRVLICLPCLEEHPRH